MNYPEIMKRISIPILSLLTVCFFFSSIKAQDKDSLDLPYKKGNWLAAMSGNLSSINLNAFNSSSGGTVNLSNEYIFEVSSGHFLFPKVALGLFANASRSESRRVSNIITERFSIGPFVRYYIGKSEKGSLFLLGGLLYGQIAETNEVQNSGTTEIIQLFGKGPGAMAGIGYTHFLTKNVGLDVSIRYDYLRFNTEINNLTNDTRTSENIQALRSFFGFGFLIIIPEFAF